MEDPGGRLAAGVEADLHRRSTNQGATAGGEVERRPSWVEEEEEEEDPSTQLVHRKRKRPEVSSSHSEHHGHHGRRGKSHGPKRLMLVSSPQESSILTGGMEIISISPLPSQEAIILTLWRAEVEARASSIQRGSMEASLKCAPPPLASKPGIFPPMPGVTFFFEAREESRAIENRSVHPLALHPSKSASRWDVFPDQSSLSRLKWNFGPNPDLKIPRGEAGLCSPQVPWELVQAMELPRDRDFMNSLSLTEILDQSMISVVRVSELPRLCSFIIFSLVFSCLADRLFFGPISMLTRSSIYMTR